jgi:NAD(P)-dependent dehydrogenase (short-subunit alcohol dehydrogenase family)
MNQSQGALLHFTFKQSLPIVWLVGGSGKLGLAISEVLQPSYNIVNISRRQGKCDAENYFNFALDLANESLVSARVQTLKEFYFPRAIVFCQRYRLDPNTSEIDRAAAMNTEIFSPQRMIEETCGVSSRGILSVVMISSINGYLIDSGLPFWYHWLKSSQIQLMKYYSQQKQFFRFNINCVTPGTFLKFSLDVYPAQHRLFLDALQETNSQKSVCTARDIAYIVEYLISDKATCINGQIITPGGGLTNKMQEELIKNYDQ